MPKYMISADVAASVWQEVEADNADEAFDKIDAYAWEQSDPNQPDSASDHQIDEIEEGEQL